MNGSQALTWANSAANWHDKTYLREEYTVAVACHAVDNEALIEVREFRVSISGLGQSAGRYRDSAVCSQLSH